MDQFKFCNNLLKGQEIDVEDHIVGWGESLSYEVVGLQYQLGYHQNYLTEVIHLHEVDVLAQI